MIIAQLVGGLGNQLFQYATTRALALRRATELRLDVSHYDGQQRPDSLTQFSRSFKLQHFNINAQVASAQDVARVRDRWRRNRILRVLTRNIRFRIPRFAFGVYQELTCNFDPVVLGLPDNVYLEGYLQSEKYFLDAEAVIRKEFTFKDPSLEAYAQRYLADLRRGTEPVVAVHVRRGDLSYSTEVMKDHNLVYGPPTTVDYFKAAMSRFDPDSTFLVFSDTSKDLDWCKENIKAKHAHYAYGHTDLQDFALIRNCDHQIISNSTFSWWAAWLNPNPEKKVVAPRVWFDLNQYPHYDPRSLIPEKWHIL